MVGIHPGGRRRVLYLPEVYPMAHRLGVDAQMIISLAIVAGGLVLRGVIMYWLFKDPEARRRLRDYFGQK